ncbi:lamin tail domain-containing protein [Congregibacter variabilis]|uniref:Lamin tail domain-containing protein n=1 Tax=Congregibacter variabilis TaxID=3081200 RepID=A0ABZ0I7J9_9GAMM|nr:lamin tail domain-containing protein [Congregibacter sp. IMCC43200]
MTTAGGLLAFTSNAFSSPILSEIHYNGVASGSDPDEFIELSNDRELSVDLTDWRFTQGISYVFAAGSTLEPGKSLVLARDPDGFRSVFADYVGDIFDFSGALSNAGETLTLSNADGIEAWSVSYDDSGDWPEQADGLGSSLQLIFGSLDSSKASNWTAQPPTPGYWRATNPSPSPVHAPMSLALLCIGLFALRSRKRVL